MESTNRRIAWNSLRGLIPGQILSVHSIHFTLSRFKEGPLCEKQKSHCCHSCKIGEYCSSGCIWTEILSMDTGEFAVKTDNSLMGYLPVGRDILLRKWRSSDVHCLFQESFVYAYMCCRQYTTMTYWESIINVRREMFKKYSNRWHEKLNPPRFVEHDMWIARPRPDTYSMTMKTDFCLLMIDRKYTVCTSCVRKMVPFTLKDLWIVHLVSSLAVFCLSKNWITTIMVRTAVLTIAFWIAIVSQPLKVGLRFGSDFSIVELHGAPGCT